MKSQTKHVMFNLPSETIDKLNMLDTVRSTLIGKGNNKSQLVKEAIDLLWQNMAQGKPREIEAK